MDRKDIIMVTLVEILEIVLGHASNNKLVFQTVRKAIKRHQEVRY